MKKLIILLITSLSLVFANTPPSSKLQEKEKEQSFKMGVFIGAYDYPPITEFIQTGNFRVRGSKNIDYKMDIQGVSFDFDIPLEQQNNHNLSFKIGTIIAIGSFSFVDEELWVWNIRENDSGIYIHSQEFNFITLSFKGDFKYSYTLKSDIFLKETLSKIKYKPYVYLGLNMLISNQTTNSDLEHKSGDQWYFAPFMGRKTDLYLAFSGGLGVDIEIKNQYVFSLEYLKTGDLSGFNFAIGYKF